MTFKFAEQSQPFCVIQLQERLALLFMRQSACYAMQLHQMQVTIAYLHAGEEASQSVLRPDTPGDAIVAVKDRRLSTSSTRYRRQQNSTARYAIRTFAVCFS